MHTNSQFAEAVEAAVTRIEEGTDAEVVVVAALRSGHYRDTALAFGVALAGLLLLLAIFLPFDVDPRWVLGDLVVGLVAGAWLAHRWPALTRILTRRSRRVAQVTNAASAAFHQDQVYATRGRTGLLIYLSALEEEVVVLPDHGLGALIPQGEWNAIRWDGRTLEGFLACLEVAGAVLAKHLPAKAGDNPDELPNAPRLRQ